MTGRNLLSGLIGAVIGVLGTYFVMEYIHDKELDSVYAELNEANDDLDEITNEPEEISLGGNLRLVLAAEEEEGCHLPLPEDEDEDEDEDGAEGEGEGEDEPSIDTFGGVYIIPPEQVSGSQVVLTYNHNDGSAEVAKMLSIPSEKFDDIIESDALLTLIDEEAFGILKRSRARSKDKDPRLICIRNNVLNLDFVISY